MVASTKKRILDSALRAFAEKGYHATKVPDIAKSAGVSPGTIYQHYRNKLDIFSSVIDDILGALDTALDDEALDASETVEEYLEQMERIETKLFALLAEHPFATEIVFYQALGIDEEINKRVRAAFDILALYTESYLRHGVKKGFLRPDLRVRESAILVNAVTFEAAGRVVQEGVRADAVESWRDALVKLLMQGMVVRAEEPS